MNLQSTNIKLNNVHVLWGIFYLSRGAGLVGDPGSGIDVVDSRRAGMGELTAFSRSYAEWISSKSSYFKAWTSWSKYNKSSWTKIGVN